MMLLFTKLSHSLLLYPKAKYIPKILYIYQYSFPQSVLLGFPSTPNRINKKKYREYFISLSLVLTLSTTFPHFSGLIIVKRMEYLVVTYIHYKEDKFHHGKN